MKSRDFKFRLPLISFDFVFIWFFVFLLTRYFADAKDTTREAINTSFAAIFLFNEMNCLQILIETKRMIWKLLLHLFIFKFAIATFYFNQDQIVSLLIKQWTSVELHAVLKNSLDWIILIWRYCLTKFYRFSLKGMPPSNNYFFRR